MARALVCGMLALALAGCGNPALGASGPALHVTRTGWRLPPLDVTVTNAARVRRLFDAAMALRKVPEGAVFACPIDFGTEYHLTFTAHNSPPTEMSLDGAGCRFLNIEPSGPGYFQTDAFRALFSQVTGIAPIDVRPEG
jgi:hypothetical protein